MAAELPANVDGPGPIAGCIKRKRRQNRALTGARKAAYRPLTREIDLAAEGPVRGGDLESRRVADPGEIGRAAERILRRSVLPGLDHGRT